MNQLELYQAVPSFASTDEYACRALEVANAEAMLDKSPQVRRNMHEYLSMHLELSPPRVFNCGVPGCQEVLLCGNGHILCTSQHPDHTNANAIVGNYLLMLKLQYFANAIQSRKKYTIEEALAPGNEFMIKLTMLNDVIKTNGGNFVRLPSLPTTFPPTPTSSSPPESGQKKVCV